MDDNKRAFRSSFKGFRKSDVYAYIESLNAQYAEEMESKDKDIAHLKAKLSESESEISRLTEDNSALMQQANNSAELSKQLSEQTERANNSEKELKAVKEKNSELDEVLSELGDKLADMQTRLEVAERTVSEQRLTIAREKDNISRAAALEAEESLKKARSEASLILARAEREASLLQKQNQKHKDDVLKILDEELDSLVERYIDEHTKQINDIFAALSVEYKKLYSENAQFHERILRSKSSAAEKVKARIVRAIDVSSTSGPFSK